MKLNNWRHTNKSVINRLCDSQCPSTHYGPNCTLPCSCHNGASCDTVTGVCACKAGFTGPKCLLGKGEDLDFLLGF